MSLYVPFLPPDAVPLARVYLTKLSAMRTGFPTYQGPAIWYLWHTLAARVASLERTCAAPGTEVRGVLVTFKTMFANFGLTHPCPDCREHLLSRLSRNDVDWRRVSVLGDLGHAMTPAGSESRVYPLEYLFLGGLNGSSIGSKLDSAVDGESLMGFVWKLHNAVSSAVEYSLECKTVERVDEPPFRCADVALTYGTFGGAAASSSSLGRTWPTARRFEQWLRGEAAWRAARASPALRAAYEQLSALDAALGPAVRQEYWGGASPDYAAGERVMRAARRLDAAMAELDLLYSEYALSSPPSCRHARAALAAYVPRSSPSPLLPDGQFPPLPAGCVAAGAAGSAD